MRFLRIFQRIGVIDRNADRATDDSRKQRVSTFHKFLARADIVVEFRARREE